MEKDTSHKERGRSKWDTLLLVTVIIAFVGGAWTIRSSIADNGAAIAANAKAIEANGEGITEVRGLIFSHITHSHGSADADPPEWTEK